MQDQENIDPEYLTTELAKHILSDCGCSTENQSLLLRVSQRIQVFMDDLNLTNEEIEFCADHGSGNTDFMKKKAAVKKTVQYLIQKREHRKGLMQAQEYMFKTKDTFFKEIIRNKGD